MSKYRPSDELAYDPKKGGWYEKATGKRVATKSGTKASTKGVFNGHRGFYDAKTGKPAANQKKALSDATKLAEPTGAPPKPATPAPAPQVASPPKPADVKVTTPSMAAPAAQAAAPVAEVTTKIAEAATHQAQGGRLHALLNQSAKVGRGVGRLGKQAAAYELFGIAQEQTEKDLKEKTGIEVNSNVSSFLNGAIPEFVMAAGSKLARLRTALLWGAGSVVFDYLTRDADATAQAEADRQATDGEIMPQTAKAKAAEDRFTRTMQLAENERTKARGAIPDGRGTSLVGVMDRGQRIAELLNKSQRARDEALAARFDADDATLTWPEYMKGEKLSKRFHAEAAKVTAQQMAQAHKDRVEKLVDTLSGGRMAQVRKAYGASAKLNAQTAQAKQRKHTNAKVGFAGTPTPYQHKFMWTDKNGKVYHRRISLPDLQSRQTSELAKYRK